jgi:hypothetical protein
MSLLWPLPRPWREEDRQAQHREQQERQQQERQQLARPRWQLMRVCFDTTNRLQQPERYLQPLQR